MAEKILQTIPIYQGKIVKLNKQIVKLPDETVGIREIVVHQGGVTIIGVENNEVLLVEQFRIAVQKDILELPAGLIEETELPHIAAIRELREETGFNAKKLIPLGSFYPSPGYATEVIHLFLATELYYDPLAQDADEFIQLKRLPIEQIPAFLQKNDTIDAKTAIGLLYFLQFYKKETT